MDEYAGYNDTSDLLKLRADLDALLAYKGLVYADDIDEPTRNDMRNSWRQLVSASENNITGADIKDALRTYIRLGILRSSRGGSQARKRPHAPEHKGPSDGLASLFDEKAPVRPRMAGGARQFPTIAWLSMPATSSNAAQPETVPNAAQAETTPAPAQPETTPADTPPASRGGTLFGSFSNEFGKCTFESQSESGTITILPVWRTDPRFEKLVATLAENSIALIATAEQGGGRLELWDLQAVDELPPGDARHTMSPELLSLMLGRLRTLPRPGTATLPHDSGTPATRPEALLSSIDDISSYLACMEDTLPQNIRAWALQNLELAQDSKASKEERGHAARALSLMLSVQWGRAPFKRVDPARARRILDEQLFGLDSVKQRVIETIVQINRTHTLPLYGLLLAGPAGVGKSQIAYATARILNLPWASLDMSTIRDLGALAGSDRIYANAKPGRVMEALAQAGSANMVLVLNELDKANEGGQNGSSADALLTLFDNLGFADNYIACSVPTDGIYPIATANDLSKISSPLLSRFEVIEIPDYTPDEKRVILREFSLPKVLAHMGLRGEEFEMTDAALDCVIERYHDESGCRGLEKAAEHLAAHALFLLESDPSLDHIRFDATDVQQVLDT